MAADSAAPNPSEYIAWYDAARGRWIGETEFRLLSRMLDAKPGSTLLDVGCGTGWFTRRFHAAGLVVTGLDVNSDLLDFARKRSAASVHFVRGDARELPFQD